MKLLKEIERQEKKWNRAKRMERKHKNRLFRLLEKQMRERQEVMRHDQ